MDTIREQRLKLRGRLLLLSQRKKLDDHQAVALAALDDLEGLTNLMLRVLRTQGTSYEQLNEIHAWLATRGYWTE